MVKKKRKAKKRLKKRTHLIVVPFIVLIVILLLVNQGDSSMISITTIIDESCGDCFDVSEIVGALQNTNFDAVTEEVIDYKSKEGQILILDYGITKVPSIVVRGDITSLDVDIPGFDYLLENDALVFGDLSPPYTETDSGTTRGYVSMIYILNSECSECADSMEIVEGLEYTGVVIPNKRTIEYSSKEGMELIEKYDVEKLPTIIFDKEVELYKNVRSGWFYYGSIEEDAYVLRTVTPLYYNVKEGTTDGFVDAVFLTDKSCETCYDVQLHEQLLSRIDIKFGIKDYVDVSEPRGIQFIQKYNITAVPTVILSSELGDYISATITIENFLSVESDGSYVFRNFDEWKAIYKDLSSGEIKNAGR